MTSFVVSFWNSTDTLYAKKENAKKKNDIPKKIPQRLVRRAEAFRRSSISHLLRGGEKTQVFTDKYGWVRKSTENTSPRLSCHRNDLRQGRFRAAPYISVQFRTHPYSPSANFSRNFFRPPLDFFPACGMVQAVDGEKPAAWCCATASTASVSGLGGGTIFCHIIL